MEKTNRDYKHSRYGLVGFWIIFWLLAFSFYFAWEIFKW